MANTQGNKLASEATLREHFAAMAMQGIISDLNNHEVMSVKDMAGDAVIYADALLSALEDKS